jgi:hypothetical protein
MTRASLLHILDNLGGISETEVQELEQLAAAFPYCQTAHLLLAKASHDRGSMLVAQRLRRAATYAVDRQRLRALIELPAPLPPAQLAAAADATRVATAPVLLEIAPQLAPAMAISEAIEEAELVEAEDAPASTGSELELLYGQTLDTLVPAAELASPEVPPSPMLEVTEPEPTVVTATAEEERPEPHNEAKNTPQPDSEVTFAEEISSTTETNTTLVEEPAPEESATTIEVEESIIEGSEAQAPEVTISADTDATTEEQSEAALVSEAADEAAIEYPRNEATEAFPDSDAPPAFNEPEVTSLSAEVELLPVAPPIRPPVEAGSSRFEFGLTQPLPVAIPSYNLFDVEKAPSKSTVVIPSFWADEEVGYAPGLGSRLGFCLQAQDEYTLDLPPSAFFEPDALLLQHLKQHQPAPPPIPKSIDLIDKFLRSKPRFRAPLPLPPTTEAQADLSVRSTVAEPSLASESLARILARQGKITKAIEIYERLMVRHPEKKAYFADQIQQLQTFE